MFLSSVKRKRQRRRTVGVAVSCSGGDELNQTMRGDYALDTAKVVAEFVIGWNPHRLTLEGLLRPREEFTLPFVREVNGLQLVVPKVRVFFQLCQRGIEKQTSAIRC